MAQFYKGNKNKDITFIVGKTVFVSGIVVAELLRASYESKINSIHNTAIKQDYIQNADICSIVRNISIAGSAVVYVWNVIDGMAVKSKQWVFLSNAQKQIAPFATFEGGGLTMNINF